MTFDISKIDWGKPASDESLVQDDPTSFVLEEAVKNNPDQYAEIGRLAKQTDTPANIVESNPTAFKQKTQVAGIPLKDIKKDAPVLHAKLGSYFDASMVHDDTESLSALERVLIYGKNVAAVPFNMSEGVSGGVEVTARTLDALLDPLARLSQQVFGYQNKPTTPFTAAADYTKGTGAGARQTAKNLTEENKRLGETEQDILGGVQSGFQSLSLMTAAIISRNPEAMLPMMAGLTAGTTASKDLDKGVPLGTTLLHSVSQGSIEYATEKLMFTPLMKMIKGDGKFLPNLLKFAATEIPGEQLATLGQDLNDWAILPENKTKSFMDYVKARPDAAISTLIGTIVGGGIQVAGVKGLSALHDRQIRKIEAATFDLRDSATVDEQLRINQMNNIIPDSKLNKRDAEAFRQHVKDIDNESDVYIESAQAAMYLQEKTPEEIEADPVLKMIQDKLKDSAMTDTDITIPVADFATDVVGSEHYEPLRDHMSLSQDSSTPFRQEQDKVEQQEYITKLVDEASENVSGYAESQDIFTTVREQLVDTGRITAQQAGTMANLVPAMMTVRAKKKGITVKEAYEQSGLLIEGPQTGKKAELSARALQQGAVQGQRVAFEVAPNPDDIQITSEWNAMTMSEKNKVSHDIAAEFVPAMLKEIGVVGELSENRGGFEGETNPAMTLKIDNPDDALEAAKAIGYMLDQKSMVVVSESDIEGTKATGAVTITLPSGFTDEDVSSLYTKLYELEHEGEKLVGGHTTENGRMVILNFSSLDNVILSDKIDAHLDGKYDIDINTLYTAFPQKEDYNYDSSPQSTTPRRTPVQGDYSGIRRAALEARSSAVRAAIEQGGAGRATSLRENAVPAEAQRGDGRGLQGLPQIRGAKANGKIQDVARDYAEKQGLDYKPPGTYASVNVKRAERIAAEFEKMEHNPSDPEVMAAYKAVIDETVAQYEAAIDSGLKVEFVPEGMEYPYEANPRMANEDIMNNNHLWVFSTREGFGSEDKFDSADNPLLRETNFEISGQVALANDLFRVVHDYFGHAKEGVGFRAGGEENAWRIHSAMFSPLARKALTTETRGQSSWLNFGQYGEANRVAKGVDTHFADQKIGLLPDWVVNEGRTDAPVQMQSVTEVAQRNSIGLYSIVEKTVIDMNIQQWKKDKPAQGTQIFSKLSKSSGVKAEELQWMGIEEYLKEGNFTREEVLEFVRSNGVQIEEVVANVAAEDSELEFDNGQVWDEEEAYIHNNEDALVEFDDGDLETSSGFDIENWFESWLSDEANAEVIEKTMRPQLDGDTLHAMDESDDKVLYLVGEGLIETDNETIRAEARDDFEEAVAAYHREQYMDYPIMVYEAETSEGVLYIFGNDDQGYDVRENDLGYQAVVLSDIWSYSEADIQAQNYAREHGLIEGGEDELTSKWSEHVAEGEHENYRELKLTLPAIEGDFEYDVHFPDRNLLTFLRVDDRDLYDGTTGEVVPAVTTGYVVSVTPNPVKDAVVNRVLVVTSTNGDELYSTGVDGSRSDAEIVETAEKALSKKGFSIGGYTSDGEGNLTKRGYTKAALPRRSYFIDEFQSDWHQQGRQKGYQLGENVGNLDEQRLEVKEAAENKADTLIESLFKHPTIIENTANDRADDTVVDDWTLKAWASGSATMGHFSIDKDNPAWLKVVKFTEEHGTKEDNKLLGEFFKLRQQELSLEKRIKAEEQGVPDAPFKGNNWINLGLKRALVDAVEQGYESFSWVDSNVLANRWSEEYRTLYEVQYDTKMPSIVKKLTGVKPVHLDFDGETFEGDAEGYWTIPITDELRESIKKDGFTLFQEGEKDTARGYYDPSQTLIRLTELSNLSTFLHEFAHFMYDTELKDTDSTEIKNIHKWFRGNAEDIAAEATKRATNNIISAQNINDYLDTGSSGFVEVDADIAYVMHEQFARGFEAYVMEGKAPSMELRKVFRTFATWLIHAYKSVKLNKPNLNPEMRKVFDRLIATEDQIAAAEARVRFEPMFTDAVMMGKTEEDYQKYLEAQKNVTEKATETLRDKLIKALRIESTKWWNDEKDDIIADEIESLKSERVHAARNALVNGDIKLDHVALKDAVGEVTTNKRGITSTRIPRAFDNMTIKGGEGLQLDDASAILGYKSGAEMIKDFIDSPKLKEAAEINAEAIMKSRHGDILTDGTIEAQADMALQNEERGELMLKEFKALTKNTNQAVITRQMLKDIADESVSKLSFRNNNPAKYRKAELRAAQEAAVMLNEGNTEGAAAAKARQALNFYLGKAAAEAKADTLSIVDFTARYRKKSVRELIMKAGNGYMEQLDKILSRFEFRKSATLKQVDQANQSLAAWIKDRLDVDLVDITLSNAVLDDSYTTHWKNVPYAELLGIRDSIKNIEHVARYDNKMTLLEEEMDFQDLVQNWTSSIYDKAQGDFTTSDVSMKHNIGERVKRTARSWMAEMTKVPFLASWLDGGERVGISNDIMVQPLVDAYDAGQTLWKEVGSVVMDALQQRSKEDIKRNNKTYFVPEAKSKGANGKEINSGNFKGHQIIAVALNTGNRGNLKKMLLGEGWANPEIDTDISFDNPKLQAVLKHVTDSDWDLVELIWGQMDKLYPQLAEVHRKTTGLTPKKVEATSITLKSGRVLAGGYYPMKYDPSRSKKAKENEDKLNASTESMLSGVGSLRVQVDAGATSERTGFYAPVKLELSVVMEHFNETIHYITYHDAVRQINKLLRNGSVADAISEKLSPEEFNQLRPWLNDVAKSGRNSPMNNTIDKIFGNLRLGLTYGIMGFKASTGISQTLGLSNAIAEVGSGNMAKAMHSITGDWSKMKDAYDFAESNSKVMAHRMVTMDRELLNAMNNIQGKDTTLSKSQRASMMHIAYIQTFTVDLPTWHAAYIKGLTDFDGNEQRAFKYADWVVENIQGSGLVHNMSSIMRNQTKTFTTLTMFMTFFSSLWNAERDLARGAKSGLYAPTQVAAMAMFMITLPYIMDALFREGFGDDDDDEDKYAKHAVKMMLSATASMPFVRDVASAATGEFDYNMTPVASLLSKGIDGISTLIEKGAEGDDVTKFSVKSSMQLGAAAAKVPGINQAWATGEHIYDVIEEGEDLSLRRLIYGPKR